MQSFWERLPETNYPSRGGVHELSESSLVEAAKRGDLMAFDTLSERYSKQLFRVAHRITRSYEDAEDAVQDSLLRAFVHVTDFDGRSSFGTWLTRIAINSALMILRKRRAPPEIATDCIDDLAAYGPREITDHQPNPEKRYAQTEEEIMLKKAIRNLRPTQRIAIQTQQLQDRSMRETAEALNISLAVAKGRLFHARSALRRSLIPKLMRQPRLGRRFVSPAGDGSARTKAKGTIRSFSAIESQERGRSVCHRNQTVNRFRVKSTKLEINSRTGS